MIFGTVWTLSFIVTFPIIYFAKAIDNGETYTCITGWTFLSRDQCKDILNHPSTLSFPENNTLCPENDLKDEFNRTLSHCEKPKYLMEKIYYATFTVVGFIVPIIVILTSYYFIMQKVHKSRQGCKFAELSELSYSSQLSSAQVFQKSSQLSSAQLSSAFSEVLTAQLSSPFFEIG